MSRIPTNDLRKAEAFNAFFFTPAIAQPRQGERQGLSLGSLFSTHPTLERRLAQLSELESELNTLAEPTVGFLDALRGRSQPVRANLDALFALPSAAVTLETAAGLVSSGNAGICWKPPASQSAEDVQREITELLGIGDAGDASSTTPAASLPTMTQQEDSYGYRWLLLEDPAIDDLVTRVHMVNTSLTEAGWVAALVLGVLLRSRP